MSQKIIDQRYMSAAIRLARRNQGLTATNPSVACVLVRDDGEGPYVIGSGITAPGGRPHAEPIALEEAGDLARGATAYVTLEPCAHHGSTPPCAQTLIDAGVTRVVTAVVDPDNRVNSRGHAMLRKAGVKVESGLGEREAVDGLSAYLIHKTQKRSQVTLKLALSADGFLGIRGKGQVTITGPLANAQSHLLRARHHGILVGGGTVAADNPSLTCRLGGLESRSPIPVVLDTEADLNPDASLFHAGRVRRTLIASSKPASAFSHLREVDLLTCESVNGKIALPELLEDLGSRGMQSLLVEGGAQVAKSFLEQDFVDELVLYRGANEISQQGEAIPAPIDEQTAEQKFDKAETLLLGADVMTRYIRRKG